MKYDKLTQFDMYSTKRIMMVSLAVLSGVSSASFGQDSPSISHYFDERAKGDAAAQKAREQFELDVCLAAVETFCPDIDSSALENASSCVTAQNKCGSPSTIVEKRVISKYGVGLTSAERDLLPMIKKVFVVLKNIDESRKNKESVFTSSVESRLDFIAKNLGMSKDAIRKELNSFFTENFPGKLGTITIDYWGYFQQGTPARAEFETAEKKLNLTLPFRWCSDKHRFVDENQRVVGDLLSMAVKNPVNQDGLLNGKQYQKLCEQLKDETADFDQANIDWSSN